MISDTKKVIKLLCLFKKCHLKKFLLHFTTFWLNDVAFDSSSIKAYQKRFLFQNLGTTLRSVHFSEEAILLISYPGELFLRILKFLTLPLLLSCLITVSASINPKVSGKMTVKTVTYFAMTSFISAVIAILMALIIQPGNVMHSSSKPVAPRMKFIDSMLDLGR